MSTPEFKTVPLAGITPSLTNPRKTFNAEKLAELAASIAASGVHQPVLVRPLPGARVPDTDPGVEYELVAGERRYRASKLAGVDTIPVLVRELSDKQVIEIQITENLQRDGLPPLEEAEGYQALLELTGITKEELCLKIGKSRTYVFNRFKLLDLCPEAREAMRDGLLDASRGELVARIPDHKLQLKALKEFTATVFNGDARMGLRACQAWVKANVMLRLEAASFNTGDETLCPTAGACGSCPKRTGANPDLFNDVDGPDLCTDPACFHAKEAAHIEQQLDERRAKGTEVVEADEMDDHLALDEPVTLPGGTRPTVAELMNKFMPVKERQRAIKAGVVGGQVVNLVSTETFRTLQDRARADLTKKAEKAGKPLPKSAPEGGNAAAQDRTKAALEERYESAWRGQVAQALKPLLLGGALGQFDAIVLRKLLAVVLEGQEWPAICKALDLDEAADEAALQNLLVTMPDAELGPRVCLALAVYEADDVHRYTLTGRTLTTPTTLQHLAASCGVDVAAIQAQVQDEMRAELAPATQAAKPKKPGKAGETSPKGAGGKKPKLTPAAAQAAIAKALQAGEADGAADGAGGEEEEHEATGAGA